MSRNIICVKPSFHVQYMPQPQSYITLKTPSKLSIQFQRCSHSQKNKIKIKLNAIIGCISKSIIASSDSFRLIISQLGLHFSGLLGILPSPHYHVLCMCLCCKSCLFDIEINLLLLNNWIDWENPIIVKLYHMTNIAVELSTFRLNHLVWQHAIKYCWIT